MLHKRSVVVVAITNIEFTLWTHLAGDFWTCNIVLLIKLVGFIVRTEIAQKRVAISTTIRGSMILWTN